MSTEVGQLFYGRSSPNGANAGDVWINDDGLWHYFDGVGWNPQETGGGGPHTHDWTDVTGEPATYPPDTHSHPESEVTNLTTDLNGKADSGHNHDAAYAPVSHSHAHTSLTGVSADQHHAQAHAVNGADHTASGLTAGHVLRASSPTAFAFAAIADGDLPSTIARDSEVTTAVSNHEGAADPHTGYQRESEKDAANGYPGLSAGSKIAAARMSAVLASSDLTNDAALEKTANKAAVNGYASLDANTRVPNAQLAGSGTPDGTTFLRGDRTWAAPGGGGVDEIMRQLTPTAWHGAPNLTTLTVLVTNTSYFLYVGRAGKVLTTLDVICRVGTAVVTITWAEVGVFKGTPGAFAGSGTLTRLGFTNVAATFNSTGIKKTTVALTGHAAEDDLWIAFGSQATTPYQLRAGLADDIQSGAFVSVAARISTMSPTAGALAAATLAVPMARLAFV